MSDKERASIQREADYSTNINALKADWGDKFEINNGMKTVEIYKALIPTIRDMLHEIGINRDFVYPDLIKNGEKALEKTLMLK